VYTFDLAGRPVTMPGLITASQYLPFGPLTTLSYTNGTTKTMSYDSRYGITENKLDGPAGTIADYTYSEDPAGNITSIHDATDATYNRDFTYDDLNRLVTANSGTSLWGAGSYAYDAMGNLTSRSLGTAPVDDGTILSVPGSHLRATASVTGVVDKLAFAYHSTTPQIDIATWNGIDHTVTYDAAGNELSYFATRTYSPRNLLASVTDNSAEGTPHTISYGYDARGVRVVRSESPTASGTSNRYFTYSPELQLLSVTDDDTSNLWASGHGSIESAPIPVSHEYAYFNGIPVGELGPPRTPDSTVALTQPRHRTSAVATTLYYTFTDHLGTPILQTDSTGAVVWRAEYEPYGNVWKMRTGARTDQPLRLPGQDLAMTWEGAEENYNVFRWYRARCGRYSQADPVALAGGLNLFAYADDRPTFNIDPLGEAVVNVTKVDEHRYQTLDEYRRANPCNAPNSYSCTERLLEDIGCPCSCKGNGYGMDVQINVQVRYHLAGGSPGSNHPVAAYWNAYRNHEDLHFADLRQQLTRYANGLEGQRFGTEQKCNAACGQVIGGFHPWLNNWAVDSNRRLH
jgi:RHS repeat-associated protein